MKRSILLLVLILVASYCPAQVDGKTLVNKVHVGSGSVQTPPIRKEVFFLVDTVTIPPTSSVTVIHPEGGRIYYHFLCLCLKDRDMYPSFYFVKRDGNMTKIND